MLTRNLGTVIAENTIPSSKERAAEDNILDSGFGSIMQCYLNLTGRTKVELWMLFECNPLALAQRISPYNLD